MDYVSIIIGIVISIVLCFFGYRLKRIAFAIVWFVIGLNLGNFLLPHITPYMQGIDPFFINILFRRTCMYFLNRNRSHFNYILQFRRFWRA